MKYPALSLLDEEKRLLWQLRTHGAQPRSTLAAALQISNSAATRLTKSLIGQGLIEEMTSEAPPRRGRPTVPLRISAAGAMPLAWRFMPGYWRSRSSIMPVASSHSPPRRSS
ncbi:MarR family transcriptional regulator [Sphingomonas sp. I4]